MDQGKSRSFKNRLAGIVKGTIYQVPDDRITVIGEINVNRAS